MTKNCRSALASSQRTWIAVAVVVAIASVAAALWSKSGGAGGNVFAVLQNHASRPLAPGGLHVDDLAADLFGYTGTVTLRAVVARVYANNPKVFVAIDSREAKICKSTGCAKFYLPVVIENDAVPRRWDEVDLRGKIVQGDRYPYFAAESVIANLGSIQ